MAEDSLSERSGTPAEGRKPKDSSRTTSAVGHPRQEPKVTDSDRNRKRKLLTTQDDGSVTHAVGSTVTATGSASIPASTANITATSSVPPVMPPKRNENKTQTNATIISSNHKTKRSSHENRKRRQEVHEGKKPGATPSTSSLMKHSPSQKKQSREYIAALETLAKDLQKERDEEIRQRQLFDLRKNHEEELRKAGLRDFLLYHATFVRDVGKWESVCEPDIYLKQPITPYRHFNASEVDKGSGSRVSRGVKAIIADSSSLHVLAQCIGYGSDRWKECKQRQFLQATQDVPKTRGRKRRNTNQIPRSIQSSVQASLSSMSSDSVSSEDSSESERIRKKLFLIHKSSGSSTSNVTSQTSGSKKQEEKRSMKPPVPQPQQTRNEQNSKTASESNNSTNATGTGSDTIIIYEVKAQEMMLLEDVLQCKFNLCTKNAVENGALSECSVPGMLRATFSRNHKLESIELIYDGISFMEQLSAATGKDIAYRIIESRLDAALSPNHPEPRVITMAKDPFAIVSISQSWTKMTGFSQIDVEGQGVFEVLDPAIQKSKNETNPDTNSNPKSTTYQRDSSRASSMMILQDVASTGMCGCFTAIHCKENGKEFIDFVCAYPLINSQNETSHLLLISKSLS